MTNKEYNGWTNYETWNCKLWIDNEEGSYHYWREQADECYRQAKGDASDDETAEEVSLTATDSLAQSLQDYFGEQQSELVGVSGMWADLLNAAVSEINWGEIAHSMIEDVDKEQFANG